MNENVKKPNLLTLLLLISFGSVGAVLYAPAMPQISDYFHVSNATMQATVALYLIGYAIGQIPYGPIANRYGRKTALYVGIGIELFAAVMSILAGALNVFALLAIARVLMALGACVGLTMVFTIIADSYESVRARKATSFCMMSFAIMPGLSIMLGGFITQHLGWQSCFYFLVLYGILMWYLVMRMPETSQCKDGQAMQLKKIIKNYSQQFGSMKLVLAALNIGCCTAIIYIFAAKAPFLVIELLKIDPGTFGLLNFVPACGILFGCLLSMYLVNYMTPMRVMFAGISLIVISLIFMFCLYYLHPHSVVAFFTPMVFLNIGLALNFTNSTNYAMSQTERKADASAAMSFINLGLAVMLVFSTGYVKDTAILELPILFSLVAVGIVVCYALLCRLQIRTNNENVRVSNGI